MNDRPRPFGVGGDPPGNWPRTPSGGGGSSRQGGCWLIALMFAYLAVAVIAAVTS